MGTAATLPGIIDVYDVKTDCRHPRKLSTTVASLLGHESGFSPDGKTFYTSGTAAGSAAVDLSNPRKPKPIFQQLDVQYHGLRLSDDGKTMYVAHVGEVTGAGLTGGGLRILDVSEIQERKPNPQVPILSYAELAGPLDPAGGGAVHEQWTRLPARGRRVRRPVLGLAGWSTSRSRR